MHDALQLAHSQLQEKLRKLGKENENMMREVLTLDTVNAKLKEKLQTLTGRLK